MYPKCHSRLYPSDIKGFVSIDVYKKYRRRFNEKFVQTGEITVGGRSRICSKTRKAGK
jgi:hypothetical protein